MRSFRGYHILVVPENAAETRRVHLSPFSVRLLVLAVALILPLVVGSLYATIHYQNKVGDMKRRFAEEKQIVEQKELLGSRLIRLERAIAGTEESLGRLEKALDVELGSMKSGLGPIEHDSIIEKGGAEITESPKVGSILDEEEALSFSSIREHLNVLGGRIEGLNSQVSTVTELNEDKLRFYHATPNTLPVDGWITSDFGFRRSPYSGVYRMHYGLDIAAPTGTTVKAPADGKVLFAEFKAGYGRKAIVDHGYGVATIYAHASELFVKKGDVIRKGQPIAAVGSSGASTGPHLHYEVHVDGIPTDPFNYVIP